MSAMFVVAILMQSTAPAPVPTSAAEKLICRSQRTTGSRLSSRKICMTARQWDAASASARQRVDTIQGGALTASGGGG